MLMLCALHSRVPEGWGGGGGGNDGGGGGGDGGGGGGGRQLCDEAIVKSPMFAGGAPIKLVVRAAPVAFALSQSNTA